MILKILKFFIAVAFIFFLFMVIVQFDMGRNNLQYAVLMKEALLMSLKFQVVALPIYLLFFRVVEMKKYFGDKNEKDKSQSLFTL